jgi:hypothetical protein
MKIPWSQTLVTQTLDALQSWHVAPDGKLRLKHKTDGYGYLLAEQLMAGTFVLHATTDEATIEFDTPEAVVAAGWAID